MTGLLRPVWMRRQLSGPWRWSGAGWQWWLAGPDGRQPARCLDDYLHHDDSSAVVQLRAKQSRPRWCYRIDDLSGPEQHWFAKRMVLSRRQRPGALLGLSHRWVGLAHGSAEFHHALMLSQRTSLGVTMLALGERLESGMPAEQALISEWLGEWTTFGHALASSPGARRVALMSALMEALRQLYNAGICHMDLHPGNLLAPRARPGENDRPLQLKVIDCARVSLKAAPDAATAIHLGVLIHELNGKRDGLDPVLEQAAGHLLRAIVGHPGPAVERLLSLVLRYSTKKPFSRHSLIARSPERLPLDRIERELREMIARRPPQTIEPVMAGPELAALIETALDQAADIPMR
ncbi:hypothetical protein [Kushneria phosphatilytica]|uniref:Uncharacterized protein n=1 Tax=Kushneria phosphatilytica TaxID=657387 RepID=A0A1S1NRL2_9GAMM|nr:hypothetical protein [Kushneria phosphatilytica]OHV07732.1 hypothetical protein BH688_16250 [Kushneria phosphatilytica]QEL10235.1 hypothetical protein FY550_03175 [Kushneria phosphatilytica]